MHVKNTLLVFIIIIILPVSSFAKSHPAIDAKSAILMDTRTGQVIYEQNADTPIQPASLIKLLSLYLVYESLAEGRVRYWDKVNISANAWKTGGSKMFIEAGSEIPLYELMKGMAVVSANDATVAVAEYLGGDTITFVKKMNDKARQLGLTHSFFKNPHGLPAKGQITTARDMLKLARAYIDRFPQALSLHSMQSYTYHNIAQHNRNLLLKRCSNVDGLKTGYVALSGYHIVVTAKRGGVRLIAVVMGAKTARIRTNEAQKLLEEGFKMVAPSQPNLAGRQNHCKVHYPERHFSR
jgi:D-alanyl-D-alanine carboxypeptidase (penicillin-binding protein 5/6)